MASTNACFTRASPTASSATGVCHLASNGIAEAETVVHGRSGASAWVSGPPPFHGRCAEALRPAWASWMPSFTWGIQPRTHSTTGFSAASFSSL